MESNLPVRKPLRMGHYDYNTPGAYFLTFCTHNRKQFLSRIVGAIHESPLQKRSIVSKTVGYIKANTSKAVKLQYGEMTLWQRGFYDHVVRNQEDYNALAQYIQENPLRWELDKLYTQE